MLVEQQAAALMKPRCAGDTRMIVAGDIRIEANKVETVGGCDVRLGHGVGRAAWAWDAPSGEARLLKIDTVT